VNRDTIKTLLGLAVIGAIVVATFLYGNAQRQAQIKRVQDAKKQQVAVVSASPTVPAASVTAAPVTPTPVVATAKPAPTSGTVAVNTPSSNALQGGGTLAPATQSPATGGTNASGQVAGAAASPATVPVTGGTGTALPQTGSGLVVTVALGIMVAAVLWLRRSEQAVLTAARSRR
jgi:LPXTG-motif cell wall-anchored protein